MEISGKATEGNRLLANLKQIEDWLREVHSLHEKNGMGWVSLWLSEDGQQAYDNRLICINKIANIISSVEKNFDFEKLAYLFSISRVNPCYALGY